MVFIFLRDFGYIQKLVYSYFPNDMKNVVLSDLSL